MNSDGNDRDYEVGYGKPPTHSRFKKGASGNVRGRPARRRNVGTILHETMFEPVVIQQNGKSRKVPAFEAILLRLRNSALGGDAAALKTILQLMTRVPTSETQSDTAPVALEEEIVFELLKDHFATLQDGGRETPARRDGDQEGGAGE